MSVFHCTVNKLKFVQKKTQLNGNTNERRVFERRKPKRPSWHWRRRTTTPRTKIAIFRTLSPIVASARMRIIMAMEQNLNAERKGEKSKKS